MVKYQQFDEIKPYKFIHIGFVINDILMRHSWLKAHNKYHNTIQY